MARPPDLAKRRAILEATEAILAEVGYAGLTIDAVAQQAGSSRVFVYRLWGSKAALVRDVLMATAADLVVPDTGTLDGDLREFAGQLVRSMSRPAYVKGIQGLIVELTADPAVYRDAHRRYVKPTDVAFGTIVDRAIERGELAERPDPRVLRGLVSGITTGLAQDFHVGAARILDTVMTALLGGVLRRG